MKKLVLDNLKEVVVIALLILVGAFLLINPNVFATGMIRVSGLLLAGLGAVRIWRYFKTDAAEAARGVDLYTGLIAACFGLFCLFSAQSWVRVFPMLAVFYGLMRIVLGFIKAQKAVDALRLGFRLWYLQAISALFSLIFGLIVALNPHTWRWAWCGC